jgi:N-acetylmuramoyl-L-alanine amidase
VPEHRRAWHAGRSYWAGEESLNDRSIGIELVNESRCSEEEPDAATLPPLAVACEFLPFDDEQIELLIVLARDILERYPGIDPVDVVGHADIAPDRKVDPGPLFPWKALHDAGIGAWYDDTTVARYRSAFRAEPPDMSTVRRGLRLYGYRVDPCGDDGLELQRILRAFQMHYLPDAVTLAADIETAATLFALLEKYRPEGLAELQAAGACDDDGG